MEIVGLPPFSFTIEIMNDNMNPYQGNTAIGIISGMLGGLGKYYLQIQTPLLLNIIGAIITAFLCGIAGVAGKELFDFIKKTVKKNKDNDPV